MKLCVFSNDSIQDYFNKGEIKERYFNPNNLFKEIHIFSPTEKDVEATKVKKISGNAKLEIYPIGKLNLLNFKSKFNDVLEIIKRIRPDVIRAYNPLMQGWLATKIAKELSIPVVVSIHNNYDKDKRRFYKKNKNYRQYLKFLYTERFIERYVILNATKIICAYRFLVPYVKRLGGKEIDLIYNRVDLTNFSPDIKPELSLNKKTIICVSRLDAEKNQECLIKSIKDLNVKLILIGKGPLYEKYNQLVNKLGINDKVMFIKSVPNEKLARYYNSADIFASPIKQGGVSIPMIEAMACGLPLIISSREDEEHEDIDEAVMFANNNPEDFKNAIIILLNEPTLCKEMVRKGLEKVKTLNGEIMEKKEESLYKEILK